MTSSPSVSINKYLLANPLVSTASGFTSKLTVFSSGTVLYSTVLQYLVYNKLDSLVQTLQLSSLYYSLNSNSPLTQPTASTSARTTTKRP